MKSRKFVLFFLVACIAAFGSLASAQNKTKELKDATKRVNESSKVFAEIMNADDTSIPEDLLAKANAIVVFPDALKVGFIVGGRSGKGLAVRRLKNGWSAPAFLNMGGGSFGLQIGAQKMDIVLLVMNDGGMESLLKDKFEIGGEGSVAAGPVGRTAAATTDATLDAQILSYSRTKGLFAGIMLKGVVISQDEDMNQAIYKKSARQILIDAPIAWGSAPKSLQKFPVTVAQYVKK